MEKVKSSKTIFHSFVYAFKGWKSSYKESRNLRFHVNFGILTVLASVFFKISLIEWLFVVLYLGAITSSEMFNTALEDAVNLLRDEAGVDYKFTGKAKDMAAGATLAITFSAVITGIVIFLPKLLNLLKITL